MRAPVTFATRLELVFTGVASRKSAAFGGGMAAMTAAAALARQLFIGSRGEAWERTTRTLATVIAIVATSAPAVIQMRSRARISRAIRAVVTSRAGGNSVG